MPNNSAKFVKLPMRNAMMRSHTGRIMAKGEGMGSVLLSKGGPGAGSSYMDIDDYISTTGINPYTRNGVQKSKAKSTGTGLKSLTEKLSKLTVAPEGVKRKNITMSF
jgi:hypothetical protein